MIDEYKKVLPVARLFCMYKQARCEYIYKNLVISKIQNMTLQH